MKNLVNKEYEKSKIMYLIIELFTNNRNYCKIEMVKLE